jgi:hypothetical protein
MDFPYQLTAAAKQPLSTCADKGKGIVDGGTADVHRKTLSFQGWSYFTTVFLRWQEEIPEKTAKFSEILLRNFNHSAPMCDIMVLFIFVRLHTEVRA